MLLDLLLYVHGKLPLEVISGRAVTLPHCCLTSLPEAAYQYLMSILSPVTDNLLFSVESALQSANAYENLHKRMCWATWVDLVAFASVYFQGVQSKRLAIIRNLKVLSSKPKFYICRYV